MSGNYQLFIISAKRPQNVAQYLDLDPIWIVPEGEEAAYKAAGAEYVIEVGTYPNLITARNFVLDLCQQEGIEYCIQMDDDLEWVTMNRFHIFADPMVYPRFESWNKEDGRKVPLREVFDTMAAVADNYNCAMVGIPPTDNDFFARNYANFNSFLVGSLMLIRVSDLRFDPNLPLKEDYDFTLQNIEKFGNVVRLNKYIFHFTHYKNNGGCVNYRDEERENQVIAYLQKKWGSLIRRHHTRSNEVTLRIPISVSNCRPFPRDRARDNENYLEKTKGMEDFRAFKAGLVKKTETENE